MNYLQLPVYEHKDLILRALEANQVVVVESPTGSGKTTQLPVILHDAGYSKNGLIGVTQPRRIAAVSVSEFIARQLGCPLPGIVGYKMRFEDKTDPSTVIKIMTDGILLQEMKLDPYLSKYGSLIVDEAHERSLNIDFILGLLKRVLEIRPEFKVMVSSATINAQVFSQYFGECPVVKIDAVTYPVTLIYDPPAVLPAPGAASAGKTVTDAILDKIDAIIERVISEERAGDILVFLSGEKTIKDCMSRLLSSPLSSYLYLVPLYGRLGKEEQERVFEKAPSGKTKVVIATNIAETSVTIDGITTVIDSGLSKLNYYNPRTFTSSLVEGPVSKASANQRKGRAGRTQPGTAYRLYTRKDFESRPLFTTEEIYRTDLSEVVLRMADLGLTTFEEFDFIAPPNREGLIAAIETLNLLNALEKDRTLSQIGKLMTEFPLSPRQSRIIVEAILRYPQILPETLIAAAFLSTQSPYILPPGEETDARKAHHRFRDPGGDFVSYLKLYTAYQEARSKAQFCVKNYLDERAMAEISNVTVQLGEIVTGLKIPLLAKAPHFPTEDYLCAVARGLIQFVCVREGRDMYRSLTADRILIHPGSVMFRMDPQYIVAGEIVRTTRMYAMSVSPLSRKALEKISGTLFERLGARTSRSIAKEASPERLSKQVRDFSHSIKIGDEVFEIGTLKGKKMVSLPWERLVKVKAQLGTDPLSMWKGLQGAITLGGTYTLLKGEKLELILSLAASLDLEGVLEKQWPRKERFNSRENLPALLKTLPDLVKPAVWKANRKDLGFICLLTDGEGNYWFTCSRGFHTSLNESLASVEALIDELGENADLEVKRVVNQTYRRLADYVG
ncbi:MAG: ATP-dependent RNA helicase [Treponema sp.]|jgi:RNA helicase HrpA|nr:ATP-dependent RNA helicase [Treponema sp.]